MSAEFDVDIMANDKILKNYQGNIKLGDFIAKKQFVQRGGYVILNIRFGVPPKNVYLKTISTSKS